MAEAHHRPGEPPEIRDEAADTPMWVPAAGLALLILGAVFLVWQTATTEDEAAETTEQVADGDEEAGAENEGDEPADEGEPDAEGNR
ncbi:MAG TPA: hypothetical protein RMH99_15480 [Sandaracinaceae bacterium LLY-WYZ-13_1]|nr:hypothetical protein [Sandaracinaceae bacterium LLY-WYZ-13_1]